MWQKQHSTEDLNAAFQSIINSESNWSALDNFTPKIVEARIDENGVLSLAGYYPTESNRVNFEQQYIYEGVAWKLLGFNISTQ